MATSRRILRSLVCSLLGAILLLAPALPGTAASGRSPELFDYCLKMFQLWQRYETWHCPNPTGQRAQAEWAVHRCWEADFEHGLPVLTRLLHRDLIPPPRAPAAAASIAEERPR